MSRAKYWVFTLNNYTEEDIQFIDNLTNSSEEVAYLSYGKEVGESGTHHLQGHLELNRRMRLSQVKAILHQRAHLEVRKGTFEQAQAYVEKDGDFVVFGERVSVGAGKRSDLDELAQEIRNGTSKRTLAETYGKEFIKYRKGIDGYFEMFTRRKFEIFLGPWKWNVQPNAEKSLILWGTAGIGKTEYAKYLLPQALFVSHLDDLGAFNEDYDGIIFDDMAFNHLPRTSQIHLVDMDNDRSIHIRYKVATIPAHTKKIFLTNESMGFIFDLNDQAIQRRVEVFHLQ